MFYRKYQMEPIRNSRVAITKCERRSNLRLPKTVKQVAQPAADQKIVHFDSEDQYIKKILIKNGWKVDNHSNQCRLKWVYNPKHNTFNELPRDSQINHFPHSHLLTTKLGLCKTLKAQRAALVDSSGSSHSSFYPRSYDLSEENDDFIKDFRQTAILNLLKKVMIAIEIQNEELFKEIYPETLMVSTLKTTKNWVRGLEDIYKKDGMYVSSSDRNNSVAVNGKIFQTLLWYFALMFTLDFQGTEESIDSKEIEYLVSYSSLDPPYNSLECHYQGDKGLIKYPSLTALRLFFGLYREASRQFKWFRADGLRNIWVVKGNESSRGRSINLVSSLEELKSLNSGTKLIQKYVQNTWIYRQTDPKLTQNYSFLRKVNSKKFDIRMWVLVRSFAPLEAYIYQEGYLRISQQPYQLTQLDCNSSHLTNFSVNWKHSPNNPENSYVLLSEFLQFLNEQDLKDKQQLTGEIHMLVRQSLRAADLSVSRSDPRCFELFGYDIILDSELKPWLLEVNMSPACKQRGRLSQELQQMGKGLLNLVGLIQNGPQDSKWIPLQIGSELLLSTKYPLPSKNDSHLSSSQYILKDPFLSCFSVRSGYPEAIEVSRVSSLLPIISHAHSNHSKPEKAFPAPINSAFLVIGKQFSSQRLRKYDAFLNRTEAVLTLERHYKRLMRTKRKVNEQAVSSLSFLNILDFLVRVTRKVKLRAFKKMKRTLNRKSLLRSKHVRLV